MKNNIKLYIFSLASFMFFSLALNCSAAYSEANLDASELDASTTAQIENFYNKLEDGKLGEDINNITDTSSVESSFNFEDYFDYNKIHFWILLVSVVLIFLILINLFQRLGEMKTQMDEYRKKVFTNFSDDIYQEDEEIEDNGNFEKEELSKNSIHSRLHIDVDSDNEDVKAGLEEDLIIDDEVEDKEEVVLKKKSKDNNKKIEIEEDESAKEFKELELDSNDDDDEEILYN